MFCIEFVRNLLKEELEKYFESDAFRLVLAREMRLIIMNCARELEKEQDRVSISDTFVENDEKIIGHVSNYDQNSVIDAINYTYVRSKCPKCARKRFEITSRKCSCCGTEVKHKVTMKKKKKKKKSRRVML